MAIIYIENKPYSVKDGQNLLHACLSLGFNLPYFCWHPAMHSVGACRQCAVKEFRDEGDTKGKIVMSCMTPANDGARISINDPEAVEFRRGITEWLMVNHPHDCPVCDEGGECHLQDMVVMTGQVYRRYRGRKRTFRNQDLGPFVNHEMNRCIQCYRCLRFYRDYAGGRDFGAFLTHNLVYFGRHESGALESEFSGNLVEVCPTGVFTDKTFKKHYTRKWDLQTAPSVCVHCSLGCNTIPGERYGMLRRIRNRYNGEINGYFLCDRGRYGYEFVNDRQRILNYRLSKAGRDGAVAGGSQGESPMDRIKEILAGAKMTIGIGSPRASLESNFALRTLVGSDSFFHGVPEPEFRLVSLIIDILKEGPARSPSLRDMERADAVFVLGEDVTQTAPMAAYYLRQCVKKKPLDIARQLHIPEWDDTAVKEAVQMDRGALFVASVKGTKLDDIARRTFRAPPDGLARLGFAVARELNEDIPAVEGLSHEEASLARDIADALHRAEHPLIVSGTSSGTEAVIQAAADIAWALCTHGHAVELCYLLRECNSMGLGLMGGRPLNEAVKAIQRGTADTVIVLENDLYRTMNQDEADILLAAKNTIVLDHLVNRTVLKANIVLPSATFAESEGTLVSNEGRAQRFYSVFTAGEKIRASWRWLRDIMTAAGNPTGAQWITIDDITDAIASSIPHLEGVSEAAPHAGFRISGMKIARQPHRYSGRTAMLAHIAVDEPKPPDDPDSPLSFSMEGYNGQPPSTLIPRFWAAGWNSVQAVNKFQSEPDGPLRGGDPGKRLIEPGAKKEWSFFKEIPPAFTPKAGKWLAVPVFHIFGSEELSARSPAVGELAPAPYLAIHPEDQEAAGLKEDEYAEVSICGRKQILRVMPDTSMPKGILGLPAGIPGMESMWAPAWIELKARKSKEKGSST
ncbi:MAG: NADH-quinone oxidoreductase subunit NuoG [Syntrophales bacterium]